MICGKWTILVIRDLAEGRTRFCELERSLEGISPRTLSLRLRALEEQGIVERHTFPEVPPRVEYSLTDKGRALLPLIEDMRAYGREWLGAACGGSTARAWPRRAILPSREVRVGLVQVPAERASTRRWRPSARRPSVSIRGGSAGTSRCSARASANARPWPALNAA